MAVPKHALVAATPRAKPFLKWAGGKTQLLTTILPHIPEKMGSYYEPFLGGGAVFLKIAQETRFKRAIVNDANKELMDTWRVVRDFPDDLVTYLRSMEHSAEEFERIRGMLPEGLPVVARAARMIYLNKTSYNGLYRVNSKGGFNAPFGRYEKPTICNEPNLRLLSDVLSRAPITLLHTDFEKSCEGAKKGDVVYFDPPYLPVSATSNFTAYTKMGFGWEEHERLVALFKKLVSKGALCIASNAGTDTARTLYADFEIHEVKARRSINSKGTGRGQVSEILVIGRPG